MKPSTAVELAMLGARNESSTFVDISARSGGSLFGIPLIVSSAVPSDSSGSTIVLLDTQAVLVGSGGIEISSARAASVEMLNNPTNNSATATATTHVSLWQTNSVSIRAVRAINWKIVGDGAVVALSGVDYASA
jgi:hypothetical protein